MIDNILAVALIMVFLGNIVASIWVTKMNCKEQRTRSVAIYFLYKEIKRHNNKTFGEENGL